MSKLLENSYRSVNIGLVNEFKILCSKSGINIHEVIDAASTKPLGFRPFKPGPGVGDTVFQSTHYLLVGLLNQKNIQQTLLNLQKKNLNVTNWILYNIYKIHHKIKKKKIEY